VKPARRRGWVEKLQLGYRVSERRLRSVAGTTFQFGQIPVGTMQVVAAKLHAQGD